MTLRSAVALLALTLTACTGSPAPDAPGRTCTSHTAVTGSETYAQHNTGTLAQIRIAKPITLTHITASVSYAQTAGPVAGLTEVLALVGVSDGPLKVASNWIPNTPVDRAFTGQTVTTQLGTGHNENPSIYSGVVATRILKSYTGAADALVDTDLSQPLPAGAVIWVRYDSRSQYPLDPEVQTVITYSQCQGAA